MNEDFQNWFDSNVSAWSFLSEYFYGDCEIEDKEKRKDIMYKWLLAAYEEGYKAKNSICLDK